MKWINQVIDKANILFQKKKSTFSFLDIAKIHFLKLPVQNTSFMRGIKLSLF